MRWVPSGTPAWVLLMGGLGLAFYAGFSLKLAARLIMEKDMP
jgi:hypothetical protein